MINTRKTLPEYASAIRHELSPKRDEQLAEIVREYEAWKQEPLLGLLLEVITCEAPNRIEYHIAKSMLVERKLNWKQNKSFKTPFI